MSELVQPDFAPVLTLIRQAQSRALRNVNHELIELYWSIGQYLNQKTESDGWGRGTVRQLAEWLARQDTGMRGFSSSNLWRMGQLYDTYHASPKLAALLRD